MAVRAVAGEHNNVPDASSERNSCFDLHRGRRGPRLAE